MTEKKPRPYKHPQINLRIPEELKIKIQELADKNGRSMNSEIIDRLEKSIIEPRNRTMNDDYLCDEVEKILDRYFKKNNLKKEKK